MLKLNKSDIIFGVFKQRTQHNNNHQDHFNKCWKTAVKVSACAIKHTTCVFLYACLLLFEEFLYKKPDDGPNMDWNM